MTFTGKGRFTERDAASRRMVVEASGRDKRGGGTARATITATLRPDGDAATNGEATLVAVNSDLVVTGRVAQFGRGMISDVSTKLLGQFTDCLSRTLAATPAGAEAAAPAAKPAASPAESTESAESTKPAAPAGSTVPAATAPSTGPGAGPPAAAPGAAAPAAAGQPAPVPPRPAAPAAAAEPIDLLGVTGVRAAAGRFLPYLLVFLLGAVVGGVVVGLLVG